MVLTRVLQARTAVADTFTTIAYEYPPGSSNTVPNHVYLTEVRVDPEYFALGTTIEETLEVEGRVVCQEAGGTDLVSQSVAAVSIGVLGELEAALNADSTLGQPNFFDCRLSTFTQSVEVGANEELFAVVDFTVTIRTHI